MAMAAPLFVLLIIYAYMQDMQGMRRYRSKASLIHTAHVYVRISVTDVPRKAMCLMSLSKLGSPSIGDHPHQPSGFVFPK